MTFFVIAGVFSALSILFLLFKFNIRKVLYFDIGVDFIASIFLMAVFFGTFAGMMAAVIGATIISVTLWALKRTIGYQKPKWNKFWYKWEAVKPHGKQY